MLQAPSVKVVRLNAPKEKHMELVSAFLLWIADVLGIKWIRQEKDRSRKVAKAITFVIAGIVVLMLFMIFWYA